jgi:hypothetical protein
VFCDYGKNYRLQDIQFSKSELVAGDRCSGHPLRVLADVCIFRCATRPIRAKPLVENTGLEPVTSWLQTRRSPS